MTRARLVVGVGMAVVVLVSAAAIEVWRTRSSQEPIPTAPPEIAVHSFATLSPQLDPWSGTGLAQHVRDALLNMSGATVGKRSNVRAPTHELYGSVSREGPRIAVSVQLLRSGRTDTVWTGAYWRSERDLTSLADELARSALRAAGDIKERSAR